jgi:NADP-dependent 3-hydroxy acid dehydrogenase YdfG
LAARGVAVGLVAREPVTLEAVANAIREGGGKAEVLPADVSNAGNVASIVEQTTRELEAMDLLRGRQSQVVSSVSTMQSNLKSAYLITRAVLPEMIQRHALRPHRKTIFQLRQYRS